ncbi:hypothetical protein [Kribbella deserti]|uniref:Uncharacterized protein n=1 Tax=Kribbella deserti TaxID=1926257 RepID=A0ABV6QKH2_9ACTN
MTDGDQSSHRNEPPRPPEADTERNESTPADRPVHDTADTAEDGVEMIEFAAHTAYLDPLSGAGLLLIPPPRDDLVLPAPREFGRHGREPKSLHRADWEYALGELERLGWIIFDDENGVPEVAGTSADGRLALCLFGDSAVVREPSLVEIARSLSALRRAANIGRP